MALNLAWRSTGNMMRTVPCFLLLVPATALAQEHVPVQPQVTFLSATDGANEISGAEDDEFFANLQLREAATMTGVAAQDKTLAESREFAREFFRAAVLDFNDEERAALRLHLDRVIEGFGDKYPLLIQRPWKFLKTRKDLCGGFSFTRGDCIVLSESTLARFIKAVNTKPLETSPGESLLLHEQLHVLQRTHPELFKPLYEQIFHFRSVAVTVHPWIDERQVTNPDGMSDNWAAVTVHNGAEAMYWIGTVLLEDKPVHTMGRDFSSVAVPVTSNGNGFEMVVGADGKPTVIPLEELSEFTSRLPIRSGYDHPNEVAAYLLTVITHGRQDPKLNGQSAQVWRKSKDWFAKNLRRN